MGKAKPEELITFLEERIGQLADRIAKLENRESETLRILQDMVNLLTKK